MLIEEEKLKGFTRLFWSQLFMAVVWGGLGTTFLYIPLVLNHPAGDVFLIRVAVIAAFFGGVFIVAASVFALIAANTFAGAHPYTRP
jgi:hypothetical protein